MAQQRLAEAERGLIYLMVENVEIRSLVAERLGDVPLPSPEGQALREFLGARADVVAWRDLVDDLEREAERNLAIDLQFLDPAKLGQEPVQAASDFTNAILADHWDGLAARFRQDLARPDLGREEAQHVTQAYKDAVARAKEFQARLSGWTAPAGTGS